MTCLKLQVLMNISTFQNYTTSVTPAAVADDGYGHLSMVITMNVF